MKKSRIILVVVIIIAIVAAIPIKSMCAVPGQTCTSEPNAGGRVSTYYENIPFAVYVLESVTKSDTGIKYSSDFESKVIDDKTIVPLKQTTLELGVAAYADTAEDALVLSTEDIREFNVEPGQTIEKEIEFTVGSDMFRNTRIYVFPFNFDREDCTNQDIEFGDSSENDASDWVSFNVNSTEEELKAGKGKITVRANVPEDIEPKTYWTSVQFVSNVQSQITTSTEDVVFVYFTVGGDSLSEACIAEN